MEGENELLEAQAHAWNHIFNYVSSMSLKCAVELGIPDIINNHGKPIKLSELVESLEIPQTKSSHLHRLMRMLVHSGFFCKQKAIQEAHQEEEEEEGYVLTLSCKLLLKDCLAPFLLLELDPALVTSWHFLRAWFKESDHNKTTSFELAHGMSIWNYENVHPEFNKLFNEAMARDAIFVMSIIVTEYKTMFEGLRTLIDVGGGIGTVAKAVVEAFPHLKCTVLDLPHVVATCKGTEKIEFVGGNMFESIPPADAVLLKWTLHVFNDEECIKILKQCRQAIIASKEKGGKVIIIEMVMDEKIGNYEKYQTQLFLDMLMMALVTGRERNESEWEKLFLEAGFAHYKITPILGLRSVIEVFP